MELIVYSRLSPKSQKAMRRRAKNFGRTYTYRPRKKLVTRLMEELGLSEQEVFDRISEERAFILRYPQYF